MTSMCLHIIFFITLQASLEHALFFLECMVNEHIVMDLVSLNKTFQRSLSLRLGKIVCVLIISTTRTNWDNQRM